MEAIRGSQKSLILVARQLGIHIGPNDIPERFKIYYNFYIKWVY